MQRLRFVRKLQTKIETIYHCTPVVMIFYKAVGLVAQGCSVRT